MSLSEYSVIKREFNENRSVPSIFISDIEYSVITSDVIKCFECIFDHKYCSDPGIFKQLI